MDDSFNEDIVFVVERNGSMVPYKTSKYMSIMGYVKEKRSFKNAKTPIKMPYGSKMPTSEKNYHELHISDEMIKYAKTMDERTSDQLGCLFVFEFRNIKIEITQTPIILEELKCLPKDFTDFIGLFIYMRIMFSEIYYKTHICPKESKPIDRYKPFDECWDDHQRHDTNNN